MQEALEETPTEDVPETSLRTETIKQWGLRLPSGAIQWGSWQGLGFSLPAERARALEVLKKTGRDVGYDELEFVTGYSWVTRVVQLTFGDDVATHGIFSDAPYAADE